MAGLLDLLKPPPPAEHMLTDPQEIDKEYRYWRLRILYTIVVGYTFFYFVRKNLSFTVLPMQEELGISKTQIGLIMTLHGLMYGVSKLFNGLIGDRTNPRYFMAIGLCCSAVMNICYGLSSAVLTFTLFWTLNGWFQGIGVAPCGRSLAQWFASKERGVKTGIWNTSTSIGAGMVAVLCSYLVGYNWRLCLFVPAGLALLGAVFVWQRLRDTPQSLGLPPIEEYSGESVSKANQNGNQDSDFRKFVMENVFLNPMMWVVSLANFFLYIVRYAILDWGPTFLAETGKVELQHSGWIVAGFEGAGIAGMLVSGWLSDKVFRGRAGRASFVSMAMCAICVFLFWGLPTQSLWIKTPLLCSVGFFVYGPQMLVVVIATNLATKRAAATAIGLTGLFGYASQTLSGVGLGWLVDHYKSWDIGFQALVVAAALSAVLFAVLWNHDHECGPNGST